MQAINFKISSRLNDQSGLGPHGAARSWSPAADVSRRRPMYDDAETTVLMADGSGLMSQTE